MLNWIWLSLIIISIIYGAFSGSMADVTKASIDSAKSAVELAIGLIGVMCFWLGLVKIAQEGGLLKILAKALRPIMTKLFKDVPPEHPAMSMMILNISSNMLGLGNAATPFGIKAMVELNKLNGKQGTASDAMCQFLAINTSGLAILPLGVIAIRASIGSNSPSSILITTFIATLCSTTAAIIAAKFLSKRPKYIKSKPSIILDNRTMSDGEIESEISEIEKPLSEKNDRIEKESQSKIKYVVYSIIAVFIIGTIRHILIQTGIVNPETLWAQKPEQFLSFSETIRIILSDWLLPVLIGAILLFGLSKKVKVYESLVEGAKEGFNVAIKIIPFLVAILVAVSMFRASGALELLINIISPVTELFGMPAEALPMALLRPLSGSGAYGIMVDIMQNHGTDSLVGMMVSTFQGSTETTFYVLAVYFGAVHVKNSRHALSACLIADAVGIIAAVWICQLLF